MTNKNDVDCHRCHGAGCVACDARISSGAVQRWADEAMYTAEPVETGSGPRVYLLGMTADPLGHIAAGASMYVGKVKKSLSDVTNMERDYYMKEMQKTKLKAPLELVNLHFLFENVTRGFTHQLVRQRTAVYMQESMRFAVKEDMASAIALPPSLAAVSEERGAQLYGDWELEGWLSTDPVERQYVIWRDAVEKMSSAYSMLVSTGMPAEDARGLAPTAVLTRVHYGTNLRALLDHAGNRLCTQAQFEWRAVFAGIAQAIREHPTAIGDEWQQDGLASLLQPVCYQVGKCVFEAEFDRHCTIRDRVTANAGVGRPSELWSVEGRAGLMTIEPINPREWLADPAAARRPAGTVGEAQGAGS